MSVCILSFIVSQQTVVTRLDRAARTAVLKHVGSSLDGNFTGIVQLPSLHQPPASIILCTTDSPVLIGTPDGLTTAAPCTIPSCSSTRCAGQPTR